MERNADSKPRLCDAGHSLIVGFVPPSAGGSSVLTHNLVTCFDPDSFTVATRGRWGEKGVSSSPALSSRRIMWETGFSRRLDEWLVSLQRPLGVRRLEKLVRSTDARVIVGCYPDYHLLSTVSETARKLRIPWIAYLHDTIVETAVDVRHEARAHRLQKAVFEEAAHLFVMSEGMADMYADRYGVDRPTPLEHVYPEPLSAPNFDRPFPPSAFWGGNVYDINASSLGRIARALSRTGVRLSVATDQTPSALAAQGIDISEVGVAFYRDRTEYLSALGRHGLMVLALNWPDESPWHEGELSTIFPTKTPEYLASGRPIIVHCPEHYYLARFFKDRDCGTVITERFDKSLETAIERIFEGGPEVKRRIRNGFRAASLFEPKRISTLFKTVVDAASLAQWGEKVSVPASAATADRERQGET